MRACAAATRLHLPPATAAEAAACLYGFLYKTRFLLILCVHRNYNARIIRARTCISIIYVCIIKQLYVCIYIHDNGQFFGCNSRYIITRVYETATRHSTSDVGNNNTRVGHLKIIYVLVSLGPGVDENR